MPKTPPVAERRAHLSEHHGVTLNDDYAWLKDENWQDVMRDPSVLQADIREYLEAENAYTETCMAPLQGLKETLFDEMKARIKEDDSSVPSSDGPYAYYQKYVTGGQHPHYCRTPGEAAKAEQVLFDGDAEADGHAFFKLATIEHSPDHKVLAYATDTNGSEILTIRFRDIASGDDLGDVIEGVSGALEWANDSKTIFYTELDDNHRPCSVKRHILGEGADQDVEVYHEDDSGFFVGVGKTESRRYILVQAHDHQTSEVHLIDADAPHSSPRLVEKREPELEYEVAHHGDRFLILTNADGAEDFKIMTAPQSAPGRENWKDSIPHIPGCLILGLQVFKEYWARIERFEGLPRIIVTEFSSGEAHEISFDEEAYSLGMNGGFEFEEPQIFVLIHDDTQPGF